MVNWVRRHPLLCFFALAYSLTWGAIGAALAMRVLDINGLQPSQLALVFSAMALGPSISGVVLTAILEGPSGLRALWRRMTHYRLHVRWYAAALTVTPALVVPLLCGLAVLIDPVFLPQWNLHLFAIGLVAGAFEEIGWTGFATPRLLGRMAIQSAGLMLGFTWAFWHALADYTGNIATMGALWPLWFAVFWLATLPPYRLLMTWLYARTSSGFLAVLMHAGYTGWLFVLSPATTVTQGLIWQGAFARALWIAALVVIASSRPARSPSQT